MNSADDLVAVAVLAEPVRRRLYLYLRERGEPVGREDAARHANISVKLAAFHLDRMAAAGLLDVDYRRLSGRVGPGAGRPAKVYSVSPRTFSVVIPQTRYSLAASMMATALSGEYAGVDRTESLDRVATDVGDRMGAEIRAQSRSKTARREAVFRQLQELGFEPQTQASGEIVLRNCIFADLSASSHRELVCGMNAALVRGMLSGAHLKTNRVEKRSEPAPTCCVCITGR
jgi:predicted ArsR family transcriptional regulator